MKGGANDEWCSYVAGKSSCDIKDVNKAGLFYVLDAGGQWHHGWHQLFRYYVNVWQLNFNVRAVFVLQADMLLWETHQDGCIAVFLTKFHSAPLQ